MDYKGFRPLKGTFSCINRVESHLSQEHDQLKLHWLHKLASLKKNHNLNMIWVISPQFDSVNVKHDTYATAKHIAKQYNIPFYDYYFDTTFVGHTEYFKDATHMNSEGAKVFSKKIAHELSLYLVQNK